MAVEITNVMAVSLDGRIGKHALESDGERRSYEFTNEDDKEWVRQLLTQSDAVVTGANSLRASGTTWLAKNNLGKYPAWVVLSNQGFDPQLPFWGQREVDRVIVSSAPVQPDLCKNSGVENWIFTKETIAQTIVKELEKRNLTRVLLFGGGAVNRLFYDAGLVNYAKITLCPLIIGGLDAPNFVNPGLSHEVKMTLVSSVARGSLVFLTYKIQK